MVMKSDVQDPPGDFDQYFPPSIQDPSEGVFELGLVMGGTVSAGAYTAGVIDFLIEALDTWEEAKTNSPTDPNIPRWETKIKAITGASGGGVIAALLGRALSFTFPPIRNNSLTGDHLKNPLYRVWVKELDIKKMLDLSDLNGSETLVSVLNAAPLEHCRDLIANYTSNFPSGLRVQRRYIPDPLPIYLTLSNLRGIPYRLDMGSDPNQSYVDHADYVRMAVFTYGGNGTLRPDEFGVSDNLGQKGAYLNWQNYAEFALGTSAFPFGFPIRSLSRPLSQLRYRPIVTTDVNGQGCVKPAIPDWDVLLPGTDTLPDMYYFASADGGMLDNEPIELCRRAISGWVSHNRRDGDLARRAILLIDPLADKPLLGPIARMSLRNTLGPLLGTLLDQARYDSRDILLAADKNCYSRFMITAQRDGAKPGEKSVACASLNAFGGFLCEEFRRHDFLLGRQNGQKYLRESLVLPIGNPLFQDWITRTEPRIVDAWTITSNGISCLPLIPLLGNCRGIEQPEPYPKGAFNADSKDFQQLLGARICGILDCVEKGFSPHSLLERLILLVLEILEPVGERKAKDAATKAIKSALDEWGLL